jgi:hypothetical protein
VKTGQAQAAPTLDHQEPAAANGNGKQTAKILKPKDFSIIKST